MLEAGPRGSPKPTLLLFHGVGEVGTGDYYPVLAQLSRERHVIAVDLPGFGRSDPTDKDFGPDRLVAAVETVVRVCAPGELDVLGHSSGAALALLFTAEHPRAVRRLIVADAAGILRPEVLLSGQLHQALKPMDDKAEVVQNVAQAVGGAMIRAVQALVPNAKAIADSGLLGDSPSIHAATALLDYNFGYAIERVRAPTLILWGEDDQVAPPRIAHLLDDRIPRSQLLFIPDSGHVLMKDQPERMAAAVDKYLTGALEPQEPAAPSATEKEPKDLVCKGKIDQTFEGVYDQLTLDDCQNFRLHRARAKRVRITGSQGRIDESEITEGLVIDDGELSVTGGSISGEVAIDVKDSRLDLAGVVVRGEKAAILVREEAKIITSVTRVKSPHTDTILHEQLDLELAQEL